MRRGVSSFVANIALAVGIAAAVAIAISFVTPRHRADPGAHALPASTHGKGAVYLKLPPLVAQKPALADDSLRPGEPLVLPVPPNVEIAQTRRLPAGEQVAALTPIQSAPSAAAPPPLTTVEVAPHEIHPVPQHDQPMRRVTIVKRETPSPSPGHAAPIPRGAGAATPDEDEDAQSGIKLAGPAIVTAALELNVAGKPLRLYGVKPPASADICAPSADYAARACPDVSRQALAARIGPDGEVSCRILATGGRSALPAACKDSTGADLATYLVEHGFALADPNDTVDYSAAETRAKAARTGLWGNR